MLKLAALFYVIIAPTLVGTLVTAAVVVVGALSTGLVALAALLGAVGAAPASWMIAKAIRGDDETA